MSFLECNCGSKDVSLKSWKKIKENLEVKVSCPCGMEDSFLIAQKDFLVWASAPEITVVFQNGSTVKFEPLTEKNKLRGTSLW